jgi:HrpA-like RNA helicase
VFKVPPRGIRKIVLSTNLAETSITVEDVVYVVDTGRVKENQRDEVKETPALVETWVSRAAAKQRRGRAGRVRPGIAYHLFSSHTHDDVLYEYQLPEVSRSASCLEQSEYLTNLSCNCHRCFGLV